MLVMSNANCYDNWSRCTPETAFATGILWKDCPEYCQKCNGKSTGKCEKVYNKECSGGYQCKCSGKDIGKSDNWLDKATCALGL
ncbi:unnamed protein product, partial [Mesorhabditis belari]|uniref:Uncharacterized protein n=1 Tax=Mesorhabditis belari TaxID=2138241 RepID=A0AAF3FJR5_9BILA